MGRVPSKPRRRTYKTGGNLPAIESEYRPIPLGRDSQGEFDSQIRALAVLVKNRGDTSIFIKEGPDTDDAHEIARGEEYRIWEPNGVSDILLKGETGDEVAEVRTLEAHNDFSFADRIEAFTRSISHFMSTATSNTNISGQDVDLTIDDAGGINVTGTVDIGQFSDTITVDDIQAGQVDIGNVTDTITIDDIQAGDVSITDVDGNTLSLDANGNITISEIQGGTVDVGQFSDTVTIDDVQAGEINISDQSGQLLNLDANGNLIVGDIQAGTVDIGQFSDTVEISNVQGGTVDIGQFTDTVTIDDIQSGEINITDVDGNTLDLDANGNITIADIESGTVDIGQFSDTVTIDDIQSGSVSISGEVVIDDVNTGTLDANITNASIPVDGSVTIDSGNITVDDISAASASFDGDITGQTNFDLRAWNRQGKQYQKFLSDTVQPSYYNIQFGNYVDWYGDWDIVSNANYDGRIDSINFRIYNSSASEQEWHSQMGFKVERNGEQVSPRETQSTATASFYGTEMDTVNVKRQDKFGENVYSYEPISGIPFEEGDTISLRIEYDGSSAPNDDTTADVEVSVAYTLLENI